MKNHESLANVSHIQRKQFKNETGITLIALIITIIVMLILVGVTINFTLNGGIITKSKTANSEYQKAADREELQLAIVASMNYQTGEIVRQNLVESLSNSWQVSSSAPYTCTSPKGNIFIVTSDGEITDGTSQGIEEEEEEFSSIKLYANKNYKSLLNGEINLTETTENYYFGVLLTGTGHVYFCRVAEGEPVAIDFLLLWACSVSQFHVVDNLEVEVDGNLVTYENAIISTTSSGEGTNKIYGYIDKDNNTITIVNSTRAGSENNDKDENGLIIKYSSIEVEAVLSPERLVTAKSLNFKVYENIIEGNDMIVKELIGLNETNHKMYTGIEYVGQAATSSGLSGLEDFPIWTYVGLDYTVIDTFEATMSDETTKTFHNVIMAQRTSDFNIVEGQYKPYGYIDGNTIVEFECNYNTDSSNMDENGYPKVYNSIAPSSEKIYNLAD